MTDYQQAAIVIEEQKVLVEKLLKLYYTRCFKMPYRGDWEEAVTATIDSFNGNQMKLLAVFSHLGEVRMTISKAQAAWLQFILALNIMNIDRVLGIYGEVMEEIEILTQRIMSQFYLSKQFKAI